MSDQLQHEILQDLKRVHAELGHAPTRAEYLAIGKFSKRQIENLGGFTVCLAAAGIKAARPSVIERAFKRKFDKFEDERKIGQRFDSEIRPWAENYVRPLGKSFTLMVRGDDHSMWVDRWINDVFFDVATRLQPDAICFNGDQNDFYEISSFNHNPQRSYEMQSEIDFVEEHLFYRARQACPKAMIDWILGNHEWRLFKYLCGQAPALSSLRCLRFDELFHLKEYGINVIARPSFVTAPTEKKLNNWKVYSDLVTVTHGFALGAQPATKELQTFGKTGVSNHVHRHTTNEKRDLNGYHQWHTNGCMCILQNGDEFIWELVNWSQGFLIVHVLNGKVFYEYVNCTDGFVCVGGKYYTRPELTKSPIVSP